MTAPEVLTLEEVRGVADRWRDEAEHYVPRLCATVEHWHREAGEQRERAEFLETEHTDFKARLGDMTGKRDRAAVDELALDAGVEAYKDCIIDCGADARTASASLSICESVITGLADSDGQRAAEEYSGIETQKNGRPWWSFVSARMEPIS